MTQVERGRRLRELHATDGIFLMPNAWDAGSAMMLASLGFEAVATTSADASTLGMLGIALHPGFMADGVDGESPGLRCCSASILAICSMANTTASGPCS